MAEVQILGHDITTPEGIMEARPQFWPEFLTMSSVCE